MIRTTIQDGIRGETRELTVNDPEYWTGPYVYQPYPKCLFRATGPQHQDLEERIVKSDAEAERLGAAWKETPDLARDYERGLQADIARAAAESNAKNLGMSQKAQDEYLAHDRAHFEHVTDVPTPKKRGRKPKVKPVEP